MKSSKIAALCALSVVLAPMAVAAAPLDPVRLKAILAMATGDRITVEGLRARDHEVLERLGASIQARYGALVDGVEIVFTRIRDRGVMFYRIDFVGVASAERAAAICEILRMDSCMLVDAKNNMRLISVEQEGARITARLEEAKARVTAFRAVVDEKAAARLAAASLRDAGPVPVVTPARRSPANPAPANPEPANPEPVSHAPARQAAPVQTTPLPSPSGRDVAKAIDEIEADAPIFKPEPESEPKPKPKPKTEMDFGDASAMPEAMVVMALPTMRPLRDGSGVVEAPRVATGDEAMPTTFADEPLDFPRQDILDQPAAIDEMVSEGMMGPASVAVAAGDQNTIELGGLSGTDEGGADENGADRDAMETIGINGVEPEPELTPDPSPSMDPGPDRSMNPGMSIELDGEAKVLDFYEVETPTGPVRRMPVMEDPAEEILYKSIDRSPAPGDGASNARIPDGVDVADISGVARAVMLDPSWKEKFPGVSMRGLSIVGSDAAASGKAAPGERPVEAQSVASEALDAVGIVSQDDGAVAAPRVATAVILPGIGAVELGAWGVDSDVSVIGQAIGGFVAADGDVSPQSAGSAEASVSAAAPVSGVLGAAAMPDSFAIGFRGDTVKFRVGKSVDVARLGSVVLDDRFFVPAAGRFAGDGPAPLQKLPIARPEPMSAAAAAAVVEGHRSREANEMALATAATPALPYVDVAQVPPSAAPSMGSAGVDMTDMLAPSGSAPRATDRVVVEFDGEVSPVSPGGALEAMLSGTPSVAAPVTAAAAGSDAGADAAPASAAVMAAPAAAVVVEPTPVVEDPRQRAMSLLEQIAQAARSEPGAGVIARPSVERPAQRPAPSVARPAPVQPAAAPAVDPARAMADAVRTDENRVRNEMGLMERVTDVAQASDQPRASNPDMRIELSYVTSRDAVSDRVTRLKEFFPEVMLMKGRFFGASIASSPGIFIVGIEAHDAQSRDDLVWYLNHMQIPYAFRR